MSGDILMGEERNRSVWPSIGLVLLLPMLYVGVYYGTVSPSYNVGPTFEPTPHYFDTSREVKRWLAAFFAPIHWLDRGLRPHVWEP